jgi:hypothetical protein
MEEGSEGREGQPDNSESIAAPTVTSLLSTAVAAFKAAVTGYMASPMSSAQCQCLVSTSC